MRFCSVVLCCVVLCCVVLYDRYEYVDRCCVRVSNESMYELGSDSNRLLRAERSLMGGCLSWCRWWMCKTIMYTTFDTGEGRNIGKPTLCNAMLCNR